MSMVSLCTTCYMINFLTDSLPRFTNPLLRRCANFMVLLPRPEKTFLKFWLLQVAFPRHHRTRSRLARTIMYLQKSLSQTRFFFLSFSAPLRVMSLDFRCIIFIFFAQAIYYCFHFHFLCFIVLFFWIFFSLCTVKAAKQGTGKSLFPANSGDVFVTCQLNSKRFCAVITVGRKECLQIT